MARRKSGTTTAAADDTAATGDNGATPTDTPPAAGGEGATTTKKTRRRRRSLGGGPAETATLVEALLRSRATGGASQDEVEAVVGWARSVRAEAQALGDAMKRPTRQNRERLADRLAAQEMNMVLLTGVLEGRIALDVKDGKILFLHGGGGSTGASSGEPVAASG